MAVIVGLSIVIIVFLGCLLWMSYSDIVELSFRIRELESQRQKQDKTQSLMQMTVFAKRDRIEELVEILDRMQDERAAVVRWLREIPESLHQSSKYHETGTGCDPDDSLSSTDQKCTM